MGQAKVRKLALVAQQEAGDTVEIPLGPRSSRRLAALLYMAQGAGQVAEVAEQAAKAATAKAQELRLKYSEAIGGVLEAHDIDAREWKILHQDDEDKIVLTPQEKTPEGEVARPDALVAPDAVQSPVAVAREAIEQIAQQVAEESAG